MPSSIPYDHPSLVLGNIVDPKLLAMLRQIGSAQAKIDSAQDKMNSFITMKRSLSMTLNELVGMNIEVGQLTSKIKQVDLKIVKAANDYINSRVENEETIQGLREQISEITTEEEVESPIDYERSKVTKLPLAADSIKLDAQYFSYGTNQEDNPLASTGSIEEYVKESTSPLGSKTSGEIAKTVSSQISLQRKKHSLAGTLIITATCTHKNAAMLSPLVIDVDKGVDIWNRIHKDEPINPNDGEELQKLEEEAPGQDKVLTILSGVTLGSSFVGMVHILNSESISESNQDMNALANKLQERMAIGGWIEDSSGGFGVDPGIANDVRKMLSTQSISSHVTMVVMGSIPSIKSNAIKMGVKTFANFDASKITSSLSVVENISSSEKRTVKSSSNSARTGARVMAMQGATITNVMNGLGDIDHKSNQSMDINSLMTAFEDYLTEIKKGESGVPINFYLKGVTKQALAKMWINKYYNEDNAQNDSEESDSKSED